MLPEGWKDYRLKDLIKSLDAGVSVNSLDDSDVNTKHKILKTSCVSIGVFDPTKTKSVTDPIEIARLSEPVQRDSIIISRMNTPILVGANGYVSDAIPNTYLPDRLWQVKPKHQSVHMHWLGFWFSLEHTRHLLRSSATGTSGSMKNITKSDVLNLPMVAPPLPEQKKIAQILSTWDNAISATERLLENSQQRKKALMQQLLTGKKRLPGFEGEWSRAELGDLGETYGGLTGKTKEDFGSGEPYITYMSVFEDGAIIPDKFGYVKLKEGGKQHSVEYGDILFTTSSETPEEVGMASVMLEKLPFKVYLNSFCFGFRLSSLDVLIPEYAKYYMRSEIIRRAIANLAQGATRYNLSKRQLLKISLHLPSVSEQLVIARVLTTADQEIEALQKRLGHLKQEKKALMQQLLTGKRRVQVEDAA